MQALAAALPIPSWGVVVLAVLIVGGTILEEVRWHREFSRSRRTVRRIEEWTR